jgi:hypothetical protein
MPGIGVRSDQLIFEHASIPATITKFFIGEYEERSPREKHARSFLDLLGDHKQPDSSCPIFQFENRWRDQSIGLLPETRTGLSRPARRANVFLCHASPERNLFEAFITDLSPRA